LKKTSSGISKISVLKRAHLSKIPYLCHGDSVKTLHTVENEPVKVFLAGIKTEGEEHSTDELAGLAATLLLNIVGAETFAVREAKSRFGMGSGKARELADKALAAGAKCIIFDTEISPSQQRNWEELSGLSVLDRQELIIRIFASRARTREAELQAELAELLYALPRLSHKYIDLSRQRGGRYGTRGAGETRLETDRRQIRQRIGFLRAEIGTVEASRRTQHKQREKQKTPVCALVGYTNAGKSSLHRALTGSDVLVEDKLFATLDPTSRRVNRLFASGTRQNIIFVDTVGFIRRLPHNLVDAFRSTLEETTKADVLIQVIDSSDPDWKTHSKTVLALLGELGAGDIARIVVLNKTDLLHKANIEALEAACKEELGGNVPLVSVSAKNKKGLDELWSFIEESIKKSKVYNSPTDTETV
jgi:GTP-binding protein HflX